MHRFFPVVAYIRCAASYFTCGARALLSVMVAATVAVLLVLPLKARAAEQSTIDSLKRVLSGVPLKSQKAVRLMNEIGFQYNMYRPDSTVAFSARALTIAEQIHDAAGIAESYRILATGYQRFGKIADATRMYLRSIPMLEELKDSVGLARAWNGLGICFFEQGDYNNAIAYYQRAEALFLAVGKMDSYASATSNISFAYLRMKYLDLAKVYAAKALRLAETHGAVAAKIYALVHLGEIERRKSHYVEAERYLNACQAYALSIHSNNVLAISRLYSVFGALYTDTREYDKARSYFDTSLTLAQKAQMRSRVKDAYEGFQHLYEVQGDFRKAYAYQNLVIRYADSLFNQESARQISAMQRELESRQQAAEILLLTKNAQIQQLTRNVLISVIVLVIVVTLVFMWLYRQVAASNKKLVEQNQAISRQQTQLARQADEIVTINAKLQRRNERLLIANDEKNQLLSIAAHDMKNPLTSIRGLAEYIVSDIGSLPLGDIRLLADRIRITSDRMFQLVKNLLDVNAIESGKITLTYYDFNLVPIIETAVQNYAEAAKAKNIRLHFTVLLKQKYELYIHANENAVIQIVDNLLSNALKYTPPGKNVSVKILNTDVRAYTGLQNTLPSEFLSNSSNEEISNEEISSGKISSEGFSNKRFVLGNAAYPANAPFDFATIEIQDEGQGFSEEDKRHLFGKFTKLSARPTAGEDSTGLGLSIVKQLTDLLQGTVVCESEYGVGTTFILRLPLASNTVEAVI